MEKMTIDQVKGMFRHIADEMIRSEALLTDIDNKIGDGDHGIGMRLGFQAVRELLVETEAKSVNELFKEIGMTMLDAMGGASGVIFGTMFISGFQAVPPTELLTLGDLGLMFKLSLENIKRRGQAGLGDKTMIDSYQPAVQALLDSAKAGCDLRRGLAAAHRAAVKGMERTKTYGANKGRAEAYGTDSIGIPDPGAVSVSIIFRAMDEYVRRLAEKEE